MNVSMASKLARVVDRNIGSAYRIYIIILLKLICLFAVRIQIKDIHGYGNIRINNSIVSSTNMIEWLYKIGYLRYVRQSIQLQLSIFLIICDGSSLTECIPNHFWRYSIGRQQRSDQYRLSNKYSLCFDEIIWLSNT